MATVPAGYPLALQRWKNQLAQMHGVVAQGAFTVKTRIVVGIGGESVLENAITVNRNWGMPFIPGSALKGLASHFLSQVLANGDPDLQPAVPLAGAPERASLPLNRYGVLFGSQDDAAYVNWLDAWFDPASSPGHPFVVDVLTPHHPGYYGKRGDASANPPWDFDDPNPVNFLAVQGAFHVALQAPDDAIADFAFEVLARALDEAGIGAKTAADYGHGTLVRLAQTAEPAQPGGVGNQATPAGAALTGVAGFLKEIADAPANELQSRYAHAWCMKWQQMEESADKVQIALAIHARWEEKPSVLKKMKEKTWASNLLAVVQQHLEKAGSA
jgi:CRISPR-associated protein Cmr6